MIGLGSENETMGLNFKFEVDNFEISVLVSSLLFLKSDRVILFDDSFVGYVRDECFIAVKCAVLH
jgi:hypothetical protein